MGAEQPKKIAKVSAAVKGSIASYKSTCEARREQLCRCLAKLLKEVGRKHKHQKELAARFPEYI